MDGRIVGLSLVCIAAAMPAAAQDEPQLLRSGESRKVELTAGPRVFTYRPSSDGWVYVYALSEAFDPVLSVGIEGGEPPQVDRDSGGGTAAFVELEVAEGARLHVELASESGEGSGRAELHLVEYAESEATRSAAREAIRRTRAAGQTRVEGDWEGARGEVRSVLASLLDTSGGRASPAVQEALLRVAAEAYQVRDLESAERAWSAVRDFKARVQPPDHGDLLAIRQNLAAVFGIQGDLERAAAEQATVLATYERLLPEDHDHRVVLQESYARTLRWIGELERARELQIAVVASRERTRPEGHHELLGARRELAVTLLELGDLSGARTMLEKVLIARERILPEHHRDLRTSRIDLARAMRTMGDLPGARALYEHVLVEAEGELPADHEEVLETRTQLAITLLGMGELETARAMFEGVLYVRRQALADDHPDLLRSQGNLAYVLDQLGEHEAARDLIRESLAAQERKLPAHHRDVLAAREDWGLIHQSAGDLEAARAILEEVAAVRATWLPEDAPELRDTRRSLARVYAGLDDREALGAELSRLARGQRRWLEGGVVLSRREARERAGTLAEGVSVLASLGGRSDRPGDVEREAFVLIETARALATEGLRTSGDESPDPELAELRARVLERRREIHRIASGATGDDTARVVARLASAVRERDRLEADVRHRLRAAGLLTADVDPQTLGRALGERAAAVGFFAYDRDEIDPDQPHRVARHRALLAHVVRSDGSLLRVELGALDEVSALVRAWRAAVGQSQGRGQPVGGDPVVPPALAAAGRALRERVLDPVLAVAGEVDTLHVCPDGPLHLVPLAVLPKADGSVVGESLRVRREVSFARLLSPEVESAGPMTALLLGGVDFDAGVTGSAEKRFAPLPGSAAEVARLAGLFAERAGSGPVLLQGAAATKRALLERAPGCGYLHLATHGTFGDAEAAGPVARAVDATWSPLDVAATVRGMAPMALCGLALAGANAGRDSLGRARGLITAEEIAGLDLKACDLAVLSACDTHIGAAGGAGLGLQSLQAALHAAGVRTTITSLWKVPDETTRELMVAFYRRIWIEREPKAEALWSVQSELRARGAPLRDWAAWVLTGDPD